MSDRPSVTTFVMETRLPWPNDASVSDRLGVLDEASLFAAGTTAPCTLLNISPLGTTIRGVGDRSAGEDVAVELATGQRAAGIIDWAKGDEAGVRFRQPIDMVALLNRKLIAQASERRKMPRVELRCPVGIKWGSNLATATLRNISASGLQAEGSGLPPRDTFVSLFVDGLNVPSGEVMWQRGNLAGIELMEEIAWSSLMPWIRDTHRRALAA
nr:PilZ domain-containing protein [uncultured Sphingomonas sp.]